MKDTYKKQKQDAFTLRLLLAEWTRVCKHSMSNHDLYTQFAQKVIYAVQKKCVPEANLKYTHTHRFFKPPPVKQNVFVSFLDFVQKHV